MAPSNGARHKRDAFETVGYWALTRNCCFEKLAQTVGFRGQTRPTHEINRQDFVLFPQNLGVKRNIQILTWMQHDATMCISGESETYDEKMCSYCAKIRSIVVRVMNSPSGLSRPSKRWKNCIGACDMRFCRRQPCPSFKTKEEGQNRGRVEKHFRIKYPSERE